MQARKRHRPAVRPGSAQDDEAGLVLAHLEMIPDSRIGLCCSHDLLRLLQRRYRCQVSAGRNTFEILCQAVGREVGHDVAVLELDRNVVIVMHDDRMEDPGARRKLEEVRNPLRRLFRADPIGRGAVVVTAAGGALTLSAGATMDLTAPNGVAYGDVVLNAQRTGETSGDIALNAAGPLNIKGAYSIALNAFWTYSLPAGSTITQATLDGYDTASTAFINAALGNAGLSARVAGLSAYGSAYHLRPGVQITSSGDLSTSGDIDLAKYRYGANADRNPNSATYGAGEAMALVIRAGGNLAVQGSISDGFRPATDAPALYSPVADVTTSSAFRPVGANFLLSIGGTVQTAAAWTVPTTWGLVLPFSRHH